MITITDRQLQGETREELGKKIAELKRDVVSKMTRLFTFDDDALKLDFDYCALKINLEVLEYLEYFLLGSQNTNWLCSVRPYKKNEIRTIADFEGLLESTKEMILGKPIYSARYNSMYFMALSFLNRIEVKEDGT